MFKSLVLNRISSAITCNMKLSNTLLGTSASAELLSWFQNMKSIWYAHTLGQLMIRKGSVFVDGRVTVRVIINNGIVEINWILRNCLYDGTPLNLPPYRIPTINIMSLISFWETGCGWTLVCSGISNRNFPETIQLNSYSGYNGVDKYSCI